LTVFITIGFPESASGALTGMKTGTFYMSKKENKEKLELLKKFKIQITEF